MNREPQYSHKEEGIDNQLPISNWLASHPQEAKDMTMLNNIRIHNSQDEIGDFHEYVDAAKNDYFMEQTCQINQYSIGAKSKRVQHMKEQMLKRRQESNQQVLEEKGSLSLNRF